MITLSTSLTILFADYKPSVTIYKAFETREDGRKDVFTLKWYNDAPNAKTLRIGVKYDIAGTLRPDVFKDADGKWIDKGAYIDVQSAVESENANPIQKRAELQNALVGDSNRLYERFMQCHAAVGVLMRENGSEITVLGYPEAWGKPFDLTNVMKNYNREVIGTDAMDDWVILDV
jgi:hypothetical protein